jgi:hypothetical protein
MFALRLRHCLLMRQVPTCLGIPSPPLTKRGRHQTRDILSFFYYFFSAACVPTASSTNSLFAKFLAMDQPPPPPSLEDASPTRSPHRKRRPGIHSARAVATQGPAPVIPTQYQPPFFTVTGASMSIQALYAHQCSLDRRHAFTNVISLILDTGASVSVTNCSADFITAIRPIQHTTLKGIAAGLTIKGLGTVRYTVRDDSGREHTITIPEVLYVPDCPSRLLCPRQVLSSTQDTDATMTVRSNGVQLFFGGVTFTVPYHEGSYLPILNTVPSLACYHSFCSTKKTLGLADSSETLPAITAAQRNKLLWHHRLNHVNFDQLTDWMRSGLLPVSSAVTNAPSPVCSTCNYGKAQRRLHFSSTGVIGAEHDAPGAGVSANQLEAGCPGLLPTTKGSPTK